MKELIIYKQHELVETTSIAAIEHYLSHEEKHHLSYTPWTAYPYKPAVTFSLAYCNTAIFLQYNVHDALIRASHEKINDAVYEDSCVEFFISFDEGATYYNLEFNCIGNVLAGYGKERNNRVLLDEDILYTLISRSLITRDTKDKMVRWQLTIVLPLHVFQYHQLSGLEGKVCKANFYKCGDQLDQPHYLSWTAILSSQPDFHLPEFFGTLKFI